MRVMTSNTISLMSIAISSARAGDKEKARTVLRSVLEQDVRNEQAWLLLAYVARNTDESRAALMRAMHLRPGAPNPEVRDALAKLLKPQYIREAAAHGVFLNYARPDELFAIQLAEDLRSNGLEVWFDMTDVPDDVEWQTAVDSAMTRCGVMIAVVTPAALSIKDTQLEHRRFSDMGKIIIPVLVETCDLGILKLGHPPVDFRTDYASGLRILLRLLAVTPNTGKA